MPPTTYTYPTPPKVSETPAPCDETTTEPPPCDEEVGPGHGEHPHGGYPHGGFPMPHFEQQPFPFPGLEHLNLPQPIDAHPFPDMDHGEHLIPQPVNPQPEPHHSLGAYPPKGFP
jgi:hypothetical protein